jgi:hypothetical protein
MTNDKSGTLGPILLASLVPMLLSIISVSAMEPTLWSPYPGIQTFLIASGWSRWVAAGAAPIVFTLIVLSTRPGQPRQRTWQLALAMALLTLLSAIYFLLRWPLGLQHQGAPYAFSMAIVNAAFLLAFWAVWALWRRSLTVGRSIGMSLLACGWLFWCAFPYFGEGM